MERLVDGLGWSWMAPELGVGLFACAEVGVVQSAHRAFAVIECVDIGWRDVGSR